MGRSVEMFNKSFSLRPLLVALLGSCLMQCLPGGAGIPPATAASMAALESRPPSFAAIAKRAMPVVVNIFTTSQRAARAGSNDPLEEFFSRFFGDTQPRENGQRSLGSGILISKDGEVLTNYHVIRNAETLTVKLADP